MSNVAGLAASTINANVILNAGAGSTQVFQVNSSNTLTFNGVVSSTNSITLSLNNPGTIVLNGANTYTGTTQWNSATSTAILGNASAFGTSTINFNQTNTIKAGADLTGSNKLTNAVTLAANTKFVNNLGYNLELGGNVNLNGAARTPVSDTGTTTFSGVISNDGGLGLVLSTLNSGGFVLSGANTYSGSTTLSGNGQVTVSTLSNSGSAGNLGSGSTINFGSTTNAGSLVYNGGGESTNRTVNLAGTTGGASIAASGSGALVFNGTFTATGTGLKTLTLTGTSTAANEIQAAIVDNSASNKTSLAKTGTGTWILSGANTFTGDATVDAGILVVNGSLANTALTVNIGGTLAGSGTFGGLATIASGAHLAPGNSPGTLTFTNGLTLASGSILDFELGTTSDLIAVTGGTLTDPSGTGGITLNLSDSGGFAAGTYTLFNFVNGQTSNFDIADFTFGTLISGTTGANYTFSLTSTSLTLTYAASAIPEPSTYAAFAGAAALALAAGSRKRMRSTLNV